MRDDFWGSLPGQNRGNRKGITKYRTSDVHTRVGEEVIQLACEISGPGFETDMGWSGKVDG